MEFLHGSPRQTTNTDLAAALCTLGIPRNAEKPLEIFVGEVERIAFFFEEASTCGLYKMGECVGMWDDPALDRSRPHHALTFMRGGLRSRSRLINYAKGTIRVGIAKRPGDRFEVVALTNPPPASQKPKRKAPEASTTPRLQTDEIELAAALLSCGVPLWNDFPIERHPDSRVSFFFHPSSPCGTFQTRELMLAWQDSTWHERHPEHPFAYLWCVFENRRRLMREIKLKNPTITFLRAGYPQFLTMNADPKTEGIFMEALKNL